MTRMATDDEKREMANGLVLGGVMLVVAVCIIWLLKVMPGFCEFEPAYEPEPAGEHSVLVSE